MTPRFLTILTGRNLPKIREDWVLLMPRSERVATCDSFFLPSGPLSLLGHIGKQFAGAALSAQSNLRRISDQFGIFGLARVFLHRHGPHGRDHS
jgi:hypothetical protein